MFRTLARLLADPRLTIPDATPSDDVFLIHPLQLSRWLELVWAQRRIAPWDPRAGGEPQNPPGTLDGLTMPNDLLDTLRSGIPDSRLPQTVPPRFDPAARGVGVEPDPWMDLPWEHLIYAYLVESTGVFEIMAEVVRRFAVGESLRSPAQPATLAWLRSTEDLFFRDPPLFSAGSVVSSLRPDARVSRRNAYWRMFGMDLPHAIPGRAVGDQPWKRDIGGGSNAGFRQAWSELLGQVWLGIQNRTNGIGPNPTDPSYIAMLGERLQQMLLGRRLNGMLGREEFAFVTIMSWFHLTIETNTPVVTDLQAQAAEPTERLTKIGQQVGITPSPYTRELLELADAMSTILQELERGSFSTSAGAPTLYQWSNMQIGMDINDIINRWQLVTGERVKDLAVRAVEPTMRPTLPAAPASSNGARTNGKTAARL